MENLNQDFQKLVAFWVEKNVGLCDVKIVCRNRVFEEKAKNIPTTRKDVINALDAMDGFWDDLNQKFRTCVHVYIYWHGEVDALTQDRQLYLCI